MKEKISAPKKGNGNSVFGAAQTLAPEERQRMIAEAAYYRAMQRGFQGGDPVADWLDAEQEIDNALLKSPDQQAGAAARNQPLVQRRTSEAQRTNDRR